MYLDCLIQPPEINDPPGPVIAGVPLEPLAVLDADGRAVLEIDDEVELLNVLTPQLGVLL